MPDARILLATAGYALAGLAYFGLTLLIAAGWRQRRQGGLLAAAALITAAWAGSTALFAAGYPAARAAMTLLEWLHLPAWLALLFHILGTRLPDEVPLPPPLRALRGLAAGLTLLLLSLPFLPLPWLESLVPMVMLLFAIIGLALVEQVYRGARREDRWAIKFLCLGLGGLLIVEFYFYANGVLFRVLDPIVWAARGFVAALVAPLIAVSAARNPRWASPLGVSRSMAFHTATLIGAGVYLLLMSVAGYYLRLFGGDWGEVVFTVFVFAAVLGGLLLLFSGTLRARLKVFLAKHFFSYRYDYRKEWLGFTHALGAERSGRQLGEHVVAALARLVESPGGALWLMEEPGWKCHGHWNWSAAAGVLPAGAPLATWLIERRWIIDLDEWRASPERYGEIELPDWLAALPDAWLVVPLFQHDELLGFVVLKHSLGKLRFNWEVGDLLKVAARQAAAHLAQMRSAEQLIVARQFESFTRATTFVVHDLKNLIAQLSLLLANAEKHQHNPEFQADMLDTVASAVARMNKVLAQLKRDSGTSPQREVALDAILREAAASKQAFRLRPLLELPPESLYVRADPAQLARAIGHLLQNALEATPADGGRVMLAARAVDGEAEIEISDNGPGMDDEFIRTRLFQPFDSTKGAGMGIGVYECRETVRALGGRISVDSAPGSGTRFTIRLPLIAHAGAAVD